MKADGSELVNLTYNMVNDWAPAWYGPQLATQATALAPTPARAGLDPFVGKWAATDPRDGSYETLTITREGDRYSVVLLDDKASLCGKDSAGKPMYGVEIKTTGTAHGTVLSTVSTSVTCLTSPPELYPKVFSFDFSYQSTTDTLTDNIDSATWTRQLGQ